MHAAAAEAEERLRRQNELQLLTRLLERLERTESTPPELAQAIRGEVAAGIIEAGQQLLTPENAELFWAALFSVAKKNVQNKAGGWLLGGVGKATNAAGWALLVVVAIWLSIGWQGVMAVGKVIASARSGQ